MRFLRRFLIRLLNLATRQSADQRLQEREIAEHLALQTEENMRAGMSPVEARRQAALKLGAAQSIREGHHAEQSIPLLENFLFDLRYAFRMLHRSPGFSLIATAIYSVIDATLLHPLPYPHPSELVRMEANLPGVGAHDIGLSVPELRDLQNSGIFQYVSLCFFGTNNLTGSAQPTSIVSKSVSPGYFAVLGVDAQLGRTFDPHDATPGFNLEVVISDGLWKRAFGADPHILGKTAPSPQVRTQIQAVDAEFVFRAETLDDVLSSSLSVRRFSMEMVALFAVRLLLASLESTATSPSWSMSNRARSPFASRWARKRHYPQDGFTPGPHSGRRRCRHRPGWRTYCFSSHGWPALRCLAL